MWTIIDAYLEALSKLLDIPREDLEIQRDFRGRYPQKRVLTQHACDISAEPTKNSDWNVYTVQRTDTKRGGLSYPTPITQFYLTQLPGCCGICVSTGAYVFADYRKKGVNKLTNGLRQAIAKTVGYTVLLCTDKADNEPEKRTLRACGWQDIFRFTNSRTQNVVDISVKVLR